MMAFEMALPRAKRVKVITETGKEELVERNTWEVLRDADQALKDEPTTEAASATDADTEATTPEQPPSAAQVLEKFISARGEMDVIIDLINNLESQQFLSVVSTPRMQRTLADLAQETALRLQAKRKQLKDVCVILRDGIKMLRDKVQLDVVFCGDISRLQRHWKVKLDGGGVPGAAASFHVDLSFSLCSGHALQQLQRDAPEITVDLLRDPSGQVAAIDRGQHGGGTGSGASDTKLAVGVEAVEKLLRSQQWRLMLRLARGQLSHELSKVRNKEEASSRVESIMAVVDSSSDSDEGERYRPLLMSLLLKCLTDNTTTMVNALKRVMAHNNLKGYVQEQMKLQSAMLPGLKVHWINTGRPATAAARIVLGEGVWGLLMLDGEEIKVEGFSRLFDDAVRWSATGSMIFSKQDIPTMLIDLTEKYQQTLLTTHSTEPPTAEVKENGFV